MSKINVVLCREIIDSFYEANKNQFDNLISSREMAKKLRENGYSVSFREPIAGIFAGVYLDMTQRKSSACMKKHIEKIQRLTLQTILGV